MASDLAPRLARNAGYHALRSVIALAALLLVTPFIIGVVGTEQYGVWALAGVVTTCLQLGDFGIGESLVKYAAEYHAVRDSARLNRMVNTALVTYLGLALLLGGALLLTMPGIAAALLHIPAPLLEEAVLIFRLAVIIFFFNMVMGIFSALVTATQQLGYTTAISIASTLLGVVGTFSFLLMGYGLRGLMATNAIVAVFVAVCSALAAWRLHPQLRLNPVKWLDREMFRQIFGYSWKVQVANLSQLLIFQVDRILLSRYLGLEAVAFYEIGSSFALYARTFALALFSPLLPAVSELHARREHELLAGLYRRALKFMAMSAIPFGLMVVGLAHPFMQAWMGEGFGLAATTLQLLLPLYLLHALTAPGAYILNGINRPEIAMRGAILAGVGNLLLCFVLVRSVGYFGLIAGIGVALLLAAAYLFKMIHRYLPEVGTAVYRGSFVRPLLFALPAAALLHFGFAALGIAGLLPVILAAAIFLGGMALLLWRGSYLDAFEREVLVGVFGRRHE